MKRIVRLWVPIIVFLVLFLTSCSGPRSDLGAGASTDRTIDVTLLQLNDVYEITPVQGGKWGGLARVASLRNQLLAENPNTYTFIAGDFFSPSALGTARVDGERLAGTQMVAALNALGLDFATFGNHEFDISKEQFYQRLSESRFMYVSNNVFDEDGKPFPGVQTDVVIKVPGQPGDTLRIGLVGVTIDSNPKDYVHYTDAVEEAKKQVSAYQGRTDAIVAVTHLALAEDMKLAEEIPDLDLIMGGHEHENILVLRGADLTPIVKADANARTVYVHRLRFNPQTGDLDIESNIRFITDALPEDAGVARVVDDWLGIAFGGFRASGLKPAQPVVDLPEPLDGLESSVRNRSTTLTDVIADAMRHVADGAELAVFNGGSIRIDDVLQPGALIEYDVIRILPFGGGVVSVDMKGSLLQRVLTQGVDNRGTGGFLQHANVDREGSTWRVNGRPIDGDDIYRVAINDFLLTGNEANLDYLRLDNPDIQKIAEHGDIRLAVIAELKRRYGGN